MRSLSTFLPLVFPPVLIFLPISCRHIRETFLSPPYSYAYLFPFNTAPTLFKPFFARREQTKVHGSPSKNYLVNSRRNWQRQKDTHSASSTGNAWRYTTSSSQWMRLQSFISLWFAVSFKIAERRNRKRQFRHYIRDDDVISLVLTRKDQQWNLLRQTERAKGRMLKEVNVIERDICTSFVWLD